MPRCAGRRVEIFIGIDPRAPRADRARGPSRLQTLQAESNSRAIAAPRARRRPIEARALDGNRWLLFEAFLDPRAYRNRHSMPCVLSRNDALGLAKSYGKCIRFGLLFGRRRQRAGPRRRVPSSATERSAHRRQSELRAVREESSHRDRVADRRASPLVEPRIDNELPERRRSLLLQMELYSITAAKS